MVVRTICVIAMIMLSTIVASAQYETVERYRVFFASREDIEAGIELFLQQNPEYQEYDGWEKILRNSGRPIYKLESSMQSHRKYGYSIDPFNYKDYILYEPNTKVYYPIQVLNCIGYVIGGSICIMNICFSDGRGVGKSITSQEQKSAIKNFKRQILPQIKKCIKQAKNERH